MKAMSDQEDLERYRWLRDNSAHIVYLSRNEDPAHNYVTAKQWIEEYCPDHFVAIDAAEVQRMKDTNTIWQLQIYPATPVGFHVWYAATLDGVIDAARASL